MPAAGRGSGTSRGAPARGNSPSRIRLGAGETNQFGALSVLSHQFGTKPDHQCRQAFPWRHKGVAGLLWRTLGAPFDVLAMDMLLIDGQEG